MLSAGLACRVLPAPVARVLREGLSAGGAPCGLRLSRVSPFPPRRAAEAVLQGRADSILTYHQQNVPRAKLDQVSVCGAWPWLGSSSHVRLGR